MQLRSGAHGAFWTEPALFVGEDNVSYRATLCALLPHSTVLYMLVYWMLFLCPAILRLELPLCLRALSLKGGRLGMHGSAVHSWMQGFDGSCSR